MVLLPLFFVLFFVFFTARPVHAAINQQINFQGKLTNTDGTNVTNGTYSIVFSIYTVASGGVAVWTETQSSVSLTDGIFRVALGSVSALPGSVDFNTSNIYLGVKVGADPEMTPRVQFTSVPAAFNSDMLDGIDSAGFILNQTGQQSLSNFNISGTGIAVTLQATTFDTATAVGLGIGSTNATAINLNQSTTLAAAKTLTVTSGSTSLNGATAGSTIAVNVTTNAATNRGIVVQGFASQTADLLQLADSSSSTIYNVDASGNREQLGYSNSPFGGSGPLGNLLVYSEAFDTATSGASWTKTNVTDPVASTIVAPNGNTTAESLVTTASGGSLAQTTSTTPTNNDYTFSIWLKSASGTQTVSLRIDGATTGVGTVNTFTVNTTWQRYSVSQNTNGFTGNIKTVLFPGGVAGSGTVHAWGAQLILSSKPGVYASTKANTIVAAKGLASNGSASFQAADGTQLLTIDGTNLIVRIGSSTTDSIQNLLQFDSYNNFSDTSTCTTTNNQGAIYYNTATASLRSCIDGAWEDILTDKGLGLLMFGVVPDSPNAGTPGDIAGVSGFANAPCLVRWSAAQEVTVSPCVAYSGGRKVIVSSTVLSTAAVAASAYVNVCLTGANSQPALGTANATETSASVPTFSVGNPVLCLATVRMTGVAGTVGNIWDVRTFTTTLKEFITINSVNSPGFLVVGNNAANNLAVTTATINTGGIRGVVVATSGTASTTTINAIVATSGMQYVKILPAAVAAINGVVETNNVLGYARTNTVFTASYSSAGLLVKGIDAACNAATNCQYSGLMSTKISR